MTVNEMITSFSQYYDKMTNLAAPGYEDSEILLFLNNAQDNFIKSRLFGDNFQPPAFEDNQKRVADLRKLVDEVTVNTNFWWPSAYYKKCRGINIPDVMFITGMLAKVTRTEPTGTEEWAECDFIKREYARKFDTVSGNKPYFRRPKYFVAGYHVWVIFDAYTTGYANESHPFFLRYIKKPTVLIVGGSCDLETYTHQEIIDIAVREAMQVSQDQRYETKVIEEKNVKTQ